MSTVDKRERPANEDFQCDEIRPVCGACHRRGLECAYGEQIAQAPITPDSSNSENTLHHSETNRSNGSTESSPISNPSPVAPPSPSITEADLIQHYLLHTSKTFEQASLRSQSFWQSAVPALAYSSRAVRLGILTAASVCMHRDVQHDPQQSLSYLQTAEYYGEQFVELSSALLRSLEPGHADEHLTCSRLLSVLAFAFFRVHQERLGITISDPSAWTWMHMLRGTSMVFKHYKDTDERVMGTIASEYRPELESSLVNQDMYKFNIHYSYIEQTRQERFVALYDAVSSRIHLLGTIQAAEVTAAIQYLEAVTNHICTDDSGALLRSIFVWPTKYSKSFADMLVSGNLLALAIHAHWLMLLVLTEQNTWITGNMGRSGIYEIAEICMNEPAADVERSLLRWPREMLESLASGTEAFDAVE